MRRTIFILMSIACSLSIIKAYKFETKENEDFNNNKDEYTNLNKFSINDHLKQKEFNSKDNLNSNKLGFLNILVKYYEEISNQYKDFKYLINELSAFFGKRDRRIDNNKIHLSNLDFDNNLKVSSFNESQLDFKNDEFNNSLRKLNQEFTVLSGNTTLNLTNENFLKCSGRGNVLNINYTEFHCDNKTINKQDFEGIKKNETLFYSQNCTVKELNTDICICPKNLRGMECELEVPVNCKIKSLFVKNNTQENKIDLLSNKNTFYYEYKNNQNLYYLDRNNLQSYLSFNVSINCSDQEAFDYNYTITLGDIKPEQLSYNIYDYLNQHLNYTKFDNFIEQKGLTVGLPTEVYLKFKLFDMNSILPFITLYYPLVEDSNPANNSGNVKDKHFANNRFSFNYNYKKNGYDLFVLNSDTIRSFICENFECDKDQKIEEIIEKNYKNKNYYYNFSNNLISYIKRKSDKTQSDWGFSDYILKDGLKFSKAKDAEMIRKASEIKDFDKQKIRNFLNGIESFDFEVNLNKLNEQLFELKNEYDLNRLVKGGRVFYEIEIVDELNDYISDCIFQGEIVLNDKFSLKSDYSWIIYASIALVALVGLSYYFFYFKKENSKADSDFKLY